MREYALHESEHREAMWPVSLIGRLFRHISRRRTLTKLVALEDHLLNDIGLSRPDVIAALKLPLSIDPLFEIERLARRRPRRGLRGS